MSLTEVDPKLEGSRAWPCPIEADLECVPGGRLMAHCIRQGTRYKRHKYVEKKCKFCGISQSDHLKDVAKRREERRKQRELTANV